MVVLLDNGHGIETKGKRSPDGCLKEYQYARDIAVQVKIALDKKGICTHLVVPELSDISLTERAKRVNQYCNMYGAKNVCLVSIHCNAAGNGKTWMNARGWEVWTSPNQTYGDVLAEEIFKEASKVLVGMKMRCDRRDGDSDKEAKFTILTNTRCAACLTENLFQDNKEDVNFLLSEQGRKAITQLHVQGILNYIKRFNE